MEFIAEMQKNVSSEVQSFGSIFLHRTKNLEKLKLSKHSLFNTLKLKSFLIDLK